jgi:hypothetical protein
MKLALCFHLCHSLHTKILFILMGNEIETDICPLSFRLIRRTQKNQNEDCSFRLRYADHSHYFL